MPHSTQENMEMARRIAERTARLGGRVYFVGGFVRDELLGKPNKDIDLEVHGITPEQLEAILSECGAPRTQGASFGIYALEGYDLDIAMPRRKDDRETADPFAGTMDAARRRDLTVNALMKDVLTGEILDHFGGLEDLKAGILRHVDPGTFREDPLRVFRTAQFAARLGFAVAPETIALCRELPLGALPRERVFGEVEKALMKAPQPSVFFETLRRMEQLEEWFPEAAALIGVPQDPEHHPEGDAWNHTMLVLDAAAALRSRAKNPLGLMLSALCHDLGKAVTTAEKNGRIHSYLHEVEGGPIAEALLRRMTNQKELQRYVANMVAMHMRPNLLVDQHAGQKAMMRMLDEAICPEDLLLLSRADRVGQRKGDGYGEKEAILRGKLEEYRQLMTRPSVQGADLAAAGFAPGPEFGEALRYAHKLHLAGLDKDAALRSVIPYLRKLLNKREKP